MAEFTAIPDANLEPDKPARGIDGLALRDNPIAIAEGAADAPRIQTAALEDLAVTEGKLGAGAVAQAKLKTNTTSLSGNIDGSAGLNLALGAYAFFPSIEGSGLNILASTTAGSADAPRIRLFNNTGSEITYNLRWRRVIA